MAFISDLFFHCQGQQKKATNKDQYFLPIAKGNGENISPPAWRRSAVVARSLADVRSL